MTVQVRIDDVERYGAIKAIMLGYLRENPMGSRIELQEGLKMTDEPFRRNLQDLEIMGAIKRIYVNDGVGRPKLIGVEICQ